MSNNVEKVVEQIIDLLKYKIDKLKDEITEICQNEVESNE
ncbi:conserved hypothetical protein [Clostridium neonatale]|nr:conserved hypothetical protein [Clostridium neonatale]CAI3617497.1 conserved hypothetical protein [Clostridium neonatale]